MKTDPDSKLHRIPTRKCPACKYVLSGATDASGKGARPSVGAYTVCISCFSYLRFGKGLTLTMVMQTEVEAMERSERLPLQLARRFVEAMNKRMKKRRGH